MPLDLASALAAAAPRANQTVWVPILQDAFELWGFATPRRIAAALGQFVAEVGDDFAELRESTNYTHAERLVAVFPREFPSVAVARPYVGDPMAIANRAYAHKLGNGDEESGDGWTFRGGGLTQLTGRETFTNFGKATNRSTEDAADWTSTPEGAAWSGCWDIWENNGLRLADGWRITALTRLINGPAMLALRDRVAASNRALEVLTA